MDFMKQVNALVDECTQVLDETGLTPRQLAEQRDALLREMQRYLVVLERLWGEPKLWSEMTQGTGIATINGYRHAIAKAEGK